MSTKIETFGDIIEAFGGPTKYAKAVEIETFHAQTMKTRDSIPASYWAKTVAAAEEGDIAGITLDVLARIAEAKAGRERAVAS